MQTHFDQDFIQQFRKHWDSQATFKTENCQFNRHPFKYAYLDSIFSDVDFLEQLRQELAYHKFYHKSNDLYEFYQSEDLKLSKSFLVQRLRETIYSSEFVNFMSQITGIPLTTERIDLTASKYCKGGYLLCHDDDIQDVQDQKDGNEQNCRRIAFILYLVPDWEQKDGGSLEIYENSLGNPTEIVDRIMPKFNRLAFFEVTPQSFHKVQEVLSDKTRLSVGGWLHGKRPNFNFSPHPTTATFTSIASTNSDYELITKWMNPIYNSKEVQSQIRDCFLEKSCIELHDFIKPSLYSQIYESLAAESTFKIGPANANRFSKYELQNFIELQQFFESLKGFFEKITGLQLETGRFIARKFESGDYTLMHDHFEEPLGIDATLFLMPHEISKECGGWTHYVADSECLLSLQPTPNKLCLVYRDQGTMRFVKYLNHFKPCQRVEADMIWSIRD